MFTINRLDLDYLLRQVEIGTDYSQLQNALDPSGLREVSGANNNIVAYDTDTGTPGPFGGWGAADEAFVRILESTYTGQAAPYGEDANGNGTGAVGADVTDASPRLISRLISNQYETNPDGSPVDADGDPSNGIQFVAEFAPNAGPLGAGSFNSWFTAFGQFFDHGLDFLGKGANGTISIPLAESDPLWIDPASPAFIPGVSNIMRISRGNLANPPADFDPGNPGQLLPGITPMYYNNTGLTIDQSQTYGSHASVNAFLREYDADGNATGRLVSGNTAVLDDMDPGNDGLAVGLATWADIKLNAARIGITLTDQDIFDAPELMTDAQGEIIRDGSGNAQLTGNLTGQAFLLDINPAANPNFAGIPRVADADNVVNDPMVPDFDPTGGFTYDDELLDAHYIAGDGRINENIALTAVHHVFHEEHNFQVENIKQNIWDDAVASGNTDNLANWLNDGADANAAFADLDWNAEYIFQAARIITETEYNHVAVGFMERLAPDLAEFVSYSSDVNPAISLEFSQAVFRLGHSMLRQTFELRDVNGNVLDEIPLLDAFLNPTLFKDTDISELVSGLVGQIGNEVDELITPALQQTLLGQPLDLAAINIARGRETGLPTFNELRDQLSKGLEQNTSNINGGALTPYTSWADYGTHLRHPEQLVNFIAAYGRDINDDWGLQAARATGDTDIMRAAAQAIIDADADIGDPNHALAVQFLNGSFATAPGDPQGDLIFTDGDLGIWDVDLWIGGLAEAPTIEGILGTTFSYIFLDQAQRLVDGDRFYYLFRLPPGTSLGDEIIRTTFTEIVERNTGTEYLSGDIFVASDASFILDDNSNFFDAAQHEIELFDLDAADGSKIFVPASEGHIIIAGKAGNDILYAGGGDDTVWGGDGDDIIRGGAGNDALFGGAGNDFITDEENDDLIDGGDGDDIIFAGKGGIDTVFGGAGNDQIHGGDGIDELFGGEGDDEIFGDGDTDVLLGENGNDYLEGGDSVDEMWGGNGNDILVGGVGDDHLNGDGGNDLMFGGLGAAANDGDRLLGDAILNQGAPVGEGGYQVANRGFDVASYENVGIAITADLQTSNQNGTASTLIDSYAFVDGIVGTRFDDDLTGAGADTITSNGFDNLLVGGGGNDILTGLGGDDWIIGDWVVVDNDLYVADVAFQDAFFAAQFEDRHGLNRVDTDGVGVENLAWLGHVLGNNGPEGNNDVAVFSGNFDDYIINDLGNGVTQVIDTRGIDSNVEGVIVPPVPDEVEAERAIAAAPLFTTGGDRLKDIEWMQFNDVRRRVNNSPPMLGAAIVLTALIQDTQRIITAAELLGAGASEITDPDGDPLTVQSVQVDTGMVTDNGDGTWTFTPEPGDTSEVVFSYEVTDGTEAIAAEASLDLLPDGPDVVVVPPGGNGDDVITGGPGNDIIEGGNGDDQILGLGGNDILFGDEGNDQIIGGDGNDVVFGGEGEDQIFGDLGNDMLFGGEGNDVIFGGDGNDIIQGGEGNDLLLGQAGNDIIDGGKDNDQIHGGLGKDMLTGGQDNDTFVFNTAAEAGNGALADMITDFQVGDKIDLSGIDANLGVGGNQGFALLNQATFTDAGQLIFRHDGGNTIVEGEVDGDNAADFRIDIVGQHNLTSSDFLGVA